MYYEVEFRDGTGNFHPETYTVSEDDLTLIWEYDGRRVRGGCYANQPLWAARLASLNSGCSLFSNGDIAMRMVWFRLASQSL